MADEIQRPELIGGPEKRVIEIVDYAPARPEKFRVHAKAITEALAEAALRIEHIGSYDMDDINFSEIVIDDGQGQLRQLIVNPNPATNQYRAPRRGQQFLIDNLADLAPADSQVAAAAGRAQAFSSGALIFNALLLGPWLAYAAIRFGLTRLQPRQGKQTAQSPQTPAPA